MLQSSQSPTPLQPNPDYIQELLGVVNSSPFPEHMAMRLVHIGPDAARVELQTGRCHLQPYNIVHGWVLATLIDTVTFWAVLLRLPQETGLVNIDLKLNYLKPLESGLLTAKGEAVRHGKRISYAEARVFDEDQELVAHGTSTLMSLPGKGLRLSAPKFLPASAP